MKKKKRIRKKKPRDQLIFQLAATSTTVRLRYKFMYGASRPQYIHEPKKRKKISHILSYNTQSMRYGTLCVSAEWMRRFFDYSCLGYILTVYFRIHSSRAHIKLKRNKDTKHRDRQRKRVRTKERERERGKEGREKRDEDLVHNI